MLQPWPSTLVVKVAVLATVASIRAQDVVFPEEKPDDCTLPNGGPGHCMDIRSCRGLQGNFHNFRPVDCSSKHFAIICCPIPEEETSSRLLENMSPPNVNFECGVNAQTNVVLDRWGFLPIQVLRPDAPNAEYPFDDIPQLNLTGRPGIPKEALDKADEAEKEFAAFVEEQEALGIHIGAAVGGVAAEKSAWPWMTLIGEYVSGNINWFCGGVLINDQWVLSALHCFLQKEPEVVRLGEHDYNTEEEGADHLDFGVTDIQWYQGYTHPEAYHDLALLKLDTTVTLTKFISPVCLPWGESRADMTGETVTLTGWGDTQYGGYPSSVLQEVNVTVFPSSRCDQKYSSLVIYKNTWPRGIQDETICAGDPEGGKDACRGDSGGPIVRLNSAGRYTLAGIVSKGHGCGLKDFPGLYANVNQLYYLKWIKEVAFQSPSPLP